MEFDDAKPLYTRYVWPRGDKSLLFKIQMVISSIMIFVGIVQATNIFLLNKQQDNSITLGFIVIIILLVVLSTINILWALKTSKLLAVSDSPQNATNTKFTQVLLFFTLILLTLYVVFFVLFQFAQSDLFNAAMASSQSDLQKYQTIYNDHKQWIHIFGYVNCVFLVFTAFTQQIMSDSKVAANLMIFLLSISLLFVSYYLLHAINVLYSVFDYPSYSFDTEPLTALKSVAVVSILLLIMIVIINLRKKEVSYLLLGTLLLLTLIVAVPSAGKVFRMYNDVNNSYTNNCHEQLGHLDYQYLASQGCQQKYIYREGSPKDCGNRFDDCFESIDNLRKTGVEEKRFITTVWEESLYPKSSQQPRIAGLSSQCCGTVVNVYSRPFLKVGALALSYIILVFFLSSYLYSNSSHPSQPNELVLSSVSKNVLLGLFFGLLLIGGIYTAVSSHSTDAVRRNTVVVNKLINIKKSNPSNTYHEYNKCTLFQHFEDESLVNSEYRQIVFADISVQKASNQYCENCQNPDLLLIISTVRGNSDNCPTNFRFDYPNPTDRVHVIPSTLAQPLANDQVCFDPATKRSLCTPCQNYFGVSGDPIQVLNYVRSSVSACNREGLKFVIQAYQVDSKLFSAQQISTKSQNLEQTVTIDTTQLKRSIFHPHSKKDKALENPRLLAGLKKLTVKLAVRDLVTNQNLSGANVQLYESYGTENTCFAGDNAKLIYQGLSTNNGIINLDFVYSTLPTTRYTIQASLDGYAINCRTFTLNEKRLFLDIGLSPELKTHQTRFVLEWGTESGLETGQDLDLYLNSNSEADKWVCYSSYFSSQCAGSVYHGDAKGDKISTEAITINALGQTKYLVFFKLPVVSKINGIVDNSIISNLKPIVKVYTQGQSRPTQVSVFDNSLQKGTFTDYEKNFRFANLAWCISGQNSEIVKYAKGFSYSVAWQIVDPDNSNTYDLPLSSVIC
ncbi:transmembrane protein, putative (macronuclear) [Tetrahymena thermophila SB210]|uniref:Transmembrane protein, putative n=1 Tax=Tetrahymena thermophila (strain SB210) TaxID=312017 RepID=Q23QL3_TETTS|nr:transmembrane protein, putative [Tetrahymena thermophila SB210]EAR98875.2 transmembrane protein, putative [Tetrahymena thermophila SB210]|eukprot:XP_001019120.2 transmembrane protein, putative [Tetrahymena thermophila SB210]